MVAFFSIALLACGEAPPPEAEPCDPCLLDDAANYTWTSTLAAPTAHLAPGEDASVDWSALAHDFYGDPLDPVAGVSRAALVALPELTPEGVSDALARDALLQADVGLFVFCAPTDARCRLTDFEIFDNNLEVERYFLAGTGTWLLALLTPADSIAAVAFLLPDGADHAVALHDGDATLALSVDFASLAPVVVSPGAPFVIDWSALTRDGLGNPLDPSTVDRLVVARFDGPLSAVADVAHRLDSAADALWEAPIAGTSADLAGLTGNTPFAGIDEEHTWLLALYCSSCLNPAPRFATVLAAP